MPLLTLTGQHLVLIAQKTLAWSGIEVATHIGVDKSAYSKIEKGSRALTVDELYKMAQLFNMTTDQIINYDGKIPKEVVIEVKRLSNK